MTWAYSGLKFESNMVFIKLQGFVVGRNSCWPARGPAGCRASTERGLTHFNLNVVVNVAFAASALRGWPARGPAGCRASSADSLQCGCHESISLFSMFLLRLRRYGPWRLPTLTHTHKFNFRVLLWAETATGRPGGRPAVGNIEPNVRVVFTECSFCGFAASALRAREVAHKRSTL